MSDGFDEAEFQQFLTDNDTYAEWAQASEEVRQRFQDFLLVRGVPLDYKAAITEDEVAICARNSGRLSTLVALRSSVDIMAGYDGPTIWGSPDFKKREQAKLIINGFDEPWLELVDQEFSGEPLQADDITLMAEVATELLEADERSARQRQLADDHIRSLLWEQGMVDTDRLAERGINVLSLLVRLSESNPSESYYGEEARVRLLKYGLTSPAWSAVIEQLFSS